MLVLVIFGYATFVLQFKESVQVYFFVKKYTSSYFWVRVLLKNLVLHLIKKNNKSSTIHLIGNKIRLFLVVVFNLLFLHPPGGVTRSKVYRFIYHIKFVNVIYLPGLPPTYRVQCTQRRVQDLILSWADYIFLG